MQFRVSVSTSREVPSLSTSRRSPTSCIPPIPVHWPGVANFLICSVCATFGDSRVSCRFRKPCDGAHRRMVFSAGRACGLQRTKLLSCFCRRPGPNRTLSTVQGAFLDERSFRRHFLTLPHHYDRGLIFLFLRLFSPAVVELTRPSVAAPPFSGLLLLPPKKMFHLLGYNSLDSVLPVDPGKGR